MRKCLTKLSRIFECGAALFMVFQLDSKDAKDGFLSDSKGAKVCKSYFIFDFGSFLPRDAYV